MYKTQSIKICLLWRQLKRKQSKNKKIKLIVIGFYVLMDLEIQIKYIVIGFMILKFIFKSTVIGFFLTLGL